MSHDSSLCFGPWPTFELEQGLKVIETTQALHIKTILLFLNHQ